MKANPQSEPSWLAWAQMEEELGLYNRAAELRNFSMQEKQIVQAPANFTTIKSMDDQGLLSKALETLGKWFERYDGLEDEYEARTNDA